MTIHELRDTDAARGFIAQGLCLQRVSAPRKESVQPALDWALELAAAGEPLPPLGFVADVGRLTLQPDHETADSRPAAAITGVRQAMLRAYEDYVLGKLYADTTFERATDAVAHYKTDRDQAKGIGFILTQIRSRCDFGGVLLSPSVIRAMMNQPSEEVLREGADSMAESGWSRLLSELFTELIDSMRDTGDILGMEDVFELEHETALVEFGQRVALRQMLKAVAEFEQGFPLQPPRTPARKQEVPTHVRDEDIYPIGGFTSISNRGSIESLLHSQLAFMEPEGAERPDLFDIKFLRDELLYYSRDENQFLRRRRTFVFALYPDLAQTRVKDAGLPCQRMILALGLLVAVVRRLIEWLSEDSLVFEFLFVDADDRPTLADERALLEMVFRTQVANGTVVFDSTHARDVAPHCTLRAQRSLCRCAVLSAKDRRIQPDDTLLTRVILAQPVPKVAGDDETPAIRESDDLAEVWNAAAVEVLRQFM